MKSQTKTILMTVAISVAGSVIFEFIVKPKLQEYLK